MARASAVEPHFDAQGRYVRDAAEARTNLAIVRGERAAHYARTVAPVLAIYAVDRSLERDYPWIGRMTVGRGAAEVKARRTLHAQRRYETTERRRLATELPAARIVEVPNAPHFVFISHAELVEQEMRAFLGGYDLDSRRSHRERRTAAVSRRRSVA